VRDAERGRRKAQPKTLVRLAAALGVAVADLDPTRATELGAGSVAG
jgi:hypothetical protein